MSQCELSGNLNLFLPGWHYNYLIVHIHKNHQIAAARMKRRFMTCLCSKLPWSLLFLKAPRCMDTFPLFDAAKLQKHTCAHTPTHTSSILSPALRVPLCAAGLSGLMCLMKTPLIISPLLSLRPMPLPPIMLIPRDWPTARVSLTLKHREEPRSLSPRQIILQVQKRTSASNLNAGILRVNLLLFTVAQVLWRSLGLFSLFSHRGLSFGD